MKLPAAPAPATLPTEAELEKAMAHDLNEFGKKHMKRLVEWSEHHLPHEKFPITMTTDGPRWMNRAERRAAKKAKL